MVKVDRDLVKDISARVGLSEHFVYKEIQLLFLLGKIMRAASAKNVTLLLKGGTAINKGYLGESQRFSEDLDLDEISNTSELKRINVLKELMKSVEEFEVSRPYKMFNSIRFDCYYLDYSGRKDYVRAEFNIKYRKLNSVEPPTLLNINSRFTLSTVLNVPVYGFEDLFARKIKTLYDRCEGKDIYDVSYGLTKEFSSTTLLRALELVAIVEIGEWKKEEFFSTITKRLKSAAEDKKLHSTTNQYIPKHLRPKNWSMFCKNLATKLEQMFYK